LPDRLRATRDERKILPRRLAKKLLPASLDLTRKQGFSLPLQAWFKGEWGRYLKDVLTTNNGDLFDTRVIRELLNGQRTGFTNTHRLFALLMVELWRREHNISIASA
jgi:asparagine synthase (glutamine-hydrolysing)